MRRGGGGKRRTVMVRSKMMTARTIVKTCLTLAATAAEEEGMGAEIESSQFSRRREGGRDRKGENVLIVNGLVFLLAVKLTTFSPNAIAPLMTSADALLRVISSAPYVLTLSNSPDVQPKKTHWMKASGLMRMSRSSG